MTPAEFTAAAVRGLRLALAAPLLRASAGLKRTALAHAAGVHSGGLSAMMLGKKPFPPGRVARLTALAKKLNPSPQPCPPSL